MNLWIDAKLVSVLRAIKSFFFPMLCGTWDLSFPTRDQTRAPCSGSTVLTTGLPGNSLDYLFFTPCALLSESELRLCIYFILVCAESS